MEASNFQSIRIRLFSCHRYVQVPNTAKITVPAIAQGCPLIVLQQQLGQYGLISDQFITKFPYEEYQTPTALGQSLMVVPRASAVVPGQTNAEPVAIHANHHNMVKYTSREDSGYKTVSRHLKDMANDAIK
ncbi:hypothetical protein QC763_0001180 [Podospora pseudopauciseta]|uniref:Uncharacterized protein n=1 Tax=Podospora pseudopauciseta TaxID=2093780 RepID=A0ABR0HVP1_9PEZI|nr:hypothetical protein QC763_0001180 [Podospora pseudopauciseta]